jgi:flagellar motor protein MotB
MADHEEKHGGGGEHAEGGHGGGSHGGGGHGGGGHGGGGEHEEAGAPEWLISFADNVALMMGFFVILLAMNMGPKGEPVQGGDPSENNNGSGGGMSRADSIIISIREGFNSPLDAKSGNPEERRLANAKKQRDESRKDEGPVGTAQRPQTVRETDYSNLGGVVYFEDSSAELTATAKATIAQVAKKLQGQRWIVELRGSVSPFESGRNPEKAMALAHERALQAGRELAKSGILWPQVRLVACGDANRKVVRSTDHAADRPNQRVEIIVTKDAMPADPYAGG